MASRNWPSVPDEHRWTIDLMEARLRRTTQSPKELRARARELRSEAARADVYGSRDAALALADRYDEAAARVGAL